MHFNYIILFKAMHFISKRKFMDYQLHTYSLYHFKMVDSFQILLKKVFLLFRVLCYYLVTKVLDRIMLMSKTRNGNFLDRLAKAIHTIPIPPHRPKNTYSN